jgi:hypothetical protein
MSTTIKIVGWMLMTIMHSGELKTAQFPTESLCKDGESLSLYGKTVAEMAHDAMLARIDREVDDALWEARNPRHKPATVAELEVVLTAKNQPDKWSANKTIDGEEHTNAWPRYAFDADNIWKIFEDGTLQKQRPLIGISAGNTVSFSDNYDWITTTRCVPIPEDANQ